MTKQDFIDRLRAALNGKVSPGLVTENVNYYEDYINTEIRKGRTEAEVLQSLGDPRLIARTIIETNTKSGQDEEQSSDYRDTGYRNAGQQTGQKVNYYGDRASGKRFRLPAWVFAIIVGIIIFLVLGVIMTILSFLAPVIIIFIVVIFLVKLFRDWLN